jgi:hypothetical protein
MELCRGVNPNSASPSPSGCNQEASSPRRAAFQWWYPFLWIKIIICKNTLCTHVRIKLVQICFPYSAKPSCILQVHIVKRKPLVPHGKQENTYFSCDILHCTITFHKPWSMYSIFPFISCHSQHIHLTRTSMHSLNNHTYSFNLLLGCSSWSRCWK